MKILFQIFLLLISLDLYSQLRLIELKANQNDIDNFIYQKEAVLLNDTSNVAIYMGSALLNNSKKGLTFFRILSNNLEHRPVVNCYLADRDSVRGGLFFVDIVQIDTVNPISQIMFSFLHLKITSIDFKNNYKTISLFPFFTNNLKIRSKLLLIDLFYNPAFYFVIYDFYNKLFFKAGHSYYCYDMTENRVITLDSRP